MKQLFKLLEANIKAIRHEQIKTNKLSRETEKKADKAYEQANLARKEASDTKKWVIASFLISVLIELGKVSYG